MKKVFMYLMTGCIAMALTSCDRDDNNCKILPPEPEMSLKVSPAELKFEGEGGREILTVDAKNVEWTVEADDWIGISMVEQAKPNEIIVTVNRLEGTERTGVVRVIPKDKKVKPVEVSVIQAPIFMEKVFWDRSTAQRLNLHGEVKSVSFYDSPARDYSAIYDLVFDESGKLTAFTHLKSSTLPIRIVLTYNDKNQLIKIKGDGQDDNYTITLGYGEHGKYIPVEDIMNDISYMTGKITNHPLWLPALIKNLKEIKVEDAINNRNNLLYAYDIKDAEGTLIQKEDAENIVLHHYTFDGAYVKSMKYTVWVTEVEKTFTYNPDNYSFAQVEEKEEEGAIVIVYNDNYTNSIQSISSIYTGEDKFTYNDNLDPAKHTKDGDEQSDRTYTYDAHNNWVKIADPINGELERTIEYQ